MKFELDRATEILYRTPVILKEWLVGLDPGWIHHNYGEDTFSPFDVIGHLVQGEISDWMTRVELILDQSESGPFPAWDRYAMFQESDGKTIEELLNEFTNLRRRNLELLFNKRITENELNMYGTHPSLGKVTLRQLLATWVAHDLNHIHQIAKCMAWQYRNEIGPWRQFITFMDR